MSKIEQRINIKSLVELEFSSSSEFKASDENSIPSLPDPNLSKQKKNWKSFTIRTITGLLMIFGFIGILFWSHAAIVTLVILLQISVFREMTALRYQVTKEKCLWGFRTVNWLFLGTTLYFFYGKATWMHLRNFIPENFYSLVYHYHVWYSFISYIICFLGIVCSFHGQSLKYQIGQTAWTVLIIAIVVVQSHFIVQNVRKGIFWFVVPHSLIITNDIWAYFIGFAFAHKFVKRSLTKLSPNKSWEGFIGSMFVTLILAVIGSRIFGSYDWFRCSLFDLEKYGGYCPANPLFTLYPLQSYTSYPLPEYIKHIQFMPVQFHSIVFALFASLISPFGGFFASAVKRAYQKKDYDTLIPGHGGVADRMDCQFIIGFFVYVYYITWIKTHILDVDEIIETIQVLPLLDQITIYNSLKTIIHKNH